MKYVYKKNDYRAKRIVTVFRIAHKCGQEKDYAVGEYSLTDGYYYKNLGFLTFRTVDEAQKALDEYAMMMGYVHA